MKTRPTDFPYIPLEIDFFDSDEANLKNKYTHFKHNFLLKYEILPIFYVMSIKTYD